MKITPMKVAAGVFLTIALLVALILGGWQAGWWFTKQNVDRQYDTNVHSQQYQGAQIDRLRNDIQGFDAATDPAQREQIRAEFCAAYPELTNPPADLDAAVARLEC